MGGDELEKYGALLGVSVAVLLHQGEIVFFAGFLENLVVGTHDVENFGDPVMGTNPVIEGVAPELFAPGLAH